MRDCQSGGEGGEREREVGDSRKFCNSPAEQVKCATCFHFRSLLSLPQLSLLPCITNWMEGRAAGRRGRHATKRRRFGGSCVTRSIATPPLGTAARRRPQILADGRDLRNLHFCTDLLFSKKRSKNSTKGSHWKKEPSFLFYLSTLFMQSARRRPNGVPKGSVIQCWVMCNNCVPHEAHHPVLDRLRERERLNALLLRITSSRMSSSPHESYTLSSQKDMAPKPQYNLKV